MSLDERVQSSVERVAQGLNAPDLDAALAIVLQRSRTRLVRRRVAAGAVAVAMLAGTAAFALRGETARTIHVATEPSFSDTSVATSTSTSVPVSPEASCPRYRFTFMPDTSYLDPDGATIHLGDHSMTIAATTRTLSLPTQIGHLELLGFPATEWSDGQGSFELRTDDGAAVCGRPVVVSGAGVGEQHLFEMVATAVEPVVSLADRQAFRAVYPSSDLADALASAAHGGLTSPMHAAVSFAFDQLDWHGAELVDQRPTADDENEADLTIRESPNGRTLQVFAVRLPGTDLWAVGSASTFTANDELGLGVEIHQDPTVPDHVGANFTGAASAELQVNYGPNGVDLTETTLPASWTFEVPAHSDIPGALIIRWRDASGKIVAVHATPLPSGDFAAG